MTREEKLQEIVEYNPCRVERSAVLRYLLAVRRNDTEQIAYFESFGKSVLVEESTSPIRSDFSRQTGSLTNSKQLC